MTVQHAPHAMKAQICEFLGISASKLDRLRIKNLIPEFQQLGRYHVAPVGQLDAIRARLRAAGLISGSQA